MKNSMRFFGLSMFVLCMALSAFAQSSTTGSITGRVVDTNGAAVPGVVVTVTSPNLIIAQTATTNDQGSYSIANLPPGRYAVNIASASGFAAFTRENVEVNLSSTSTVDVDLQAAGATAVVNITDTAGAAIDTSANTTGTNVSSEQFSNFPTQRTVQSLYSIAPTVTRSGLRDSSGRERDPSVGGSSGPENNYILDGVAVSDPAFGGSGANLPFEFVQEVEIKTGAFGAEYGKSTGGIFNVVTKSGSNSFRGDAFAYFSTKSMVRSVKPEAIPFTGSAADGFSEIDAGFDIGGPIVKDKLWFFGAFNPQRRKNFFLTQTFLRSVNNEVTTPFYAGKLTWGVNQNHTLTLSTFGDFTKQEGFLFGQNGFGNPDSFVGTTETGGSNYAIRLNSTFNPRFIGEFSGGIHLQRANTLPGSDSRELITDNFALFNGTAVLTPVATAIPAATGGILLSYVNGTGLGTTGVQRNFVRQGWGLQSNQDRNRYEFAARMQNIWNSHTLKYGFEYASNRYKILTNSTGPTRNFLAPASGIFNGFRVTNAFAICQGVAPGAAGNIVCPNATIQGRAAALIAGGQFPGQYTTSTVGAVSLGSITNPILIANTYGVRDFRLDTHGDYSVSNTESFYIQDDIKVSRNVQVNLGLRWDYQQAKGSNTTYFSLNSFRHNMQPRLGFTWDFTGEGRGKLFVNYARFIETPLPLDLNVRAGGDSQQIDYNIRVNQLNAPAGSVAVADFGNLGGDRTPIDAGLLPQSMHDVTAGFEWEAAKDFVIGMRGIYRAQDEVIEDGSFDDGHTYFIFNPGRTGTSGQPTTEDLACAGSTDPAAPFPAQCFGPARRYYRALEFTATKRFTNNYQFIASYVYSSLIGNYEGLFRNDNGQSDPNITSLFDLVSLLNGLYGRLPNDRPHQFKFDGSYRWPFKLLTSASFRANSGIPFDQLIPHPLYGNNEGFGVPRGTAINPFTGSNRTPTIYQLDLGAYYPIQMGENRQLRLQVDWFNVTNAQRAQREDTTFRINSGAAGIPPVDNPFFGRGTIFQFPSALRLGVKFQF
ncbi:MAG: TonB-dependent receptor [Pyrinomonadaceae bacterium]|nr:TonB-dependent receptor [Pyrinomonadaceae bacterium]